MDLREIIDLYGEIQKYAEIKNMKSVLLYYKKGINQYFKVIENIAYVEEVKEIIYEKETMKQIQLRFANEGLYYILKPINTRIKTGNYLYAIQYYKHYKLFFNELQYFPIRTLKNTTINNEAELFTEYMKKSKIKEFTGSIETEIYSPGEKEKLYKCGTSNFYCALSNSK